MHPYQEGATDTCEVAHFMTPPAVSGGMDRTSGAPTPVRVGEQDLLGDGAVTLAALDAVRAGRAWVQCAPA